MKDLQVVKKDNLNSILSLSAYFGAILALFLVTEFVFAGAGDIGDLSSKIADKMEGVVKLITAGAYVGGVAFALMGMLKFKAHKDNPTQVPLSQPIVLLAIAAGLVFLPFIIQSGGATIWGTTSTDNTAKGTTSVTGN